MQLIGLAFLLRSTIAYGWFKTFQRIAENQSYMADIRNSFKKKIAWLKAQPLILCIAGIGLVASTVLCIAFFTYWWHFSSYPISTNPTDWGPFGDFIGGIANPIFSFFALIALLLTLAMQSKQLEAARKELDRTQAAAAEQISQLKKEAKKSDIYRVIQILELRLEKLYREPITFLLDGVLEHWQLYLLFSHAQPRVLKNVPDISDIGPIEYRNDYLRSKATLTQLHETLVKLSMQLTMLTVTDDEEQISIFYDPTINYLAKKLKEIGYLPESDAATIEHSYMFRNTIRQNKQEFNFKMHQARDNFSKGASGTPS
jgi:uncharacterized membrane protein